MDEVYLAMSELDYFLISAMLTNAGGKCLNEETRDDYFQLFSKLEDQYKSQQSRN